MKANDQIDKISEFLDEKKDEIEEKIRKKEFYLPVDFKEVSLFDLEIAEELLENPDDIIQAGRISIERNFNIPNFHIRFFNLPKSTTVLIRHLRSKHLGKLVSIDGVVKQKTDVRPQVHKADFECPSCGKKFIIEQKDSKIKEPSMCGCGRKGKFKLVKKELIDAQKIVLEENPEKIGDGSQPKKIGLFLTEDLVSPLSETRTNPGASIQVTGILKEVPIETKTGAQSVRFDLIVETNHIKPNEESFLELKISQEEEEEILGVARDPKLVENLVKSAAPSIHGHDNIKKAILLQMFGGVQKKRKDGVITRGDMHILLVGDPGCGKSQLLKRSSLIAPKARFVSGKGASGAGLTAAVVKDEFLGGWSLEAGALVLANNGLCCIDEMDKMTSEDRSAMHEALEQQTISISKANIQATLACRTTVLAAANPKLGRFDNQKQIVGQIDLPPPLISRFDLIFPLKDIPDKKKDKRLAQHLLSLHKDPETQECPYESLFLRKYIAYSKRINPQLSDGALDEIKRYYVDVRNRAYNEDEGKRTVSITARHLEAMVRLSEAIARMQLLPEVKRKHAKEGIELLHMCLTEVGVDPETGELDTDIITTGVSSSKRNKILTIKKIINDLESRSENNIVSIKDIIKEASEHEIDEDTCRDSINNLKRTGDIYEPKPGFYKKM
ncbi:minichromosome maintenance protein MCM [Candidatus Woesearchaeota archaeon]|nr:minichromosome maintenance protein MCM [Candidatus Woesearchaeota archaeon]